MLRGAAAYSQVRSSRYQIVEPTRAANNYRHYSEQDVRVLVRAKQLVDAGTPIGEVALVGRKRLLQDAPPLAIEGPTIADGTRPPLDAFSPTALADAACFLESDDAHQAITDAVLEGTGSCFARIWLAEDDPRYLRLVASAGLSRRIAESPRARIDLQTYPYMVGWVARTQQRILRTGLEHDPRFDPVWVASERLVAAVVLPLERDRQLVGVMAAFFRQPITRATLRRMQTFGVMATAAVGSRVDGPELPGIDAGVFALVDDPSGPRHAPRGQRHTSKASSQDHRPGPATTGHPVPP